MRNGKKLSRFKTMLVEMLREECHVLSVRYEIFNVLPGWYVKARAPHIRTITLRSIRTMSISLSSNSFSTQAFITR